MISAQKGSSAEFVQLQQAFASDLAEASKVFAAALRELRIGAISSERLATIRHTAHGLAGSAGYFGRHALGRSARRLQQAANATTNTVDVSTVRSGLEVMIDLIDEINPAPNSVRQVVDLSQALPAEAAGHAVKILIAEDHSVTQDILKLVLTQRGHSVDIVSDGAEALRALRSNAYDVALLDFHLPKMDGVQVASSFIAESGSGPRTKFIAMTADIEGLLAHQQNCETFDKIAPKPVDIGEICKSVESLNDEGKRPGKAPAGAVSLLARDDAPANEDLSALLALDRNFLRWPQDLNPKRLSARALQATIRKENFDALLIEELRGAADISSIWNVRFLHLLPVIDCTGRLGARADFNFFDPSRNDVKKIEDLIEGFNSRCALLHHDILYSDDLGAKILARLFVSNTFLSPIYDERSRTLFQYNTLLGVEVIDQQVKALTEKRLLKPRFFDRVHVCGRCQSSQFNVREECPQCRSPDIAEESYLHHFKCAYQGPESDFRRGEDLVCPKCRSELRHFGHDYDRPGIMVKCNACGHATSEPMVGFVCVSCGAHTDGDSIETRDVFSYELTDQAIAYLEGGNAVLGFSQNRLRFSELPLDLIIALNEEAKKYNDSRAPFALLEFAYRNERTIHQEAGSRQFTNIRKLFLENLRNVLGDEAKVVQGRGYDYVLLRGKVLADARRHADLVCESAAKDLKQDPGATVTVFGPEDLR